MKKKIGIYYFENPVHSKRADRSINESFLLPYTGLRKIVGEINRNEYTITSFTGNRFDEFDIVLISMISFYDIVNILKEVPAEKKCKIIVGGPACINIRTILKHIDAAYFGRCDCGTINKVLELDQSLKALWIKKHDASFENKYEVGITSRDGMVNKTPGLWGEVEEILENGVGCNKKCYFCFYSWWNKYVSIDHSGYRSGYADYEDCLTSLDWNKCLRGGISAIDGMNDGSRKMAGKKITKLDIETALLKSNEIETKTLLRLKLYNIYGYPWDAPGDFENKFDVVDSVKSVDKHLKNKVLIKLHNSHFIPYPKTPLALVRFNKYNFRNEAVKKSVLFEGENITLYSGGTYSQSPLLAGCALVALRAEKDTADDIAGILNKKNLKKAYEILIEKHTKIFNEINIDPIENIKTCNEKYLKRILRCEKEEDTNEL